MDAFDIKPGDYFVAESHTKDRWNPYMCTRLTKECLYAINLNKPTADETRAQRKRVMSIGPVFFPLSKQGAIAVAEQLTQDLLRAHRRYTADRDSIFERYSNRYGSK